MATFSKIDKWQDAFVEYSVPEIQQLNARLKEHVTAKKLELRDLVGNRYRDMLKTADIILAMNETISKEDDALSDLCTAGKYSAWATHAASIAKFTDPSNSRSLTTQSTEKLLGAVIMLIRRHLRVYNAESYGEIKYHQDHVLIARGIWLGKLLLHEAKESMGKRRYLSTKAELDNIQKNFMETVNLLLMKGEGFDSIAFPSYNNLFLADSILNQCNPTETLDKTLSSRLEHISSQLDGIERPEETLPHILKLISGTFSIAKLGFQKNSLYRLILQQTEVYSLLDSPEFVGKAELNMNRYKRWLPESITSKRAFPASCSESMSNSTRSNTKSNVAMTQLLNSFGHNVAKILSEKLSTIFDSIYDLHTLVELYRNVLLLVQDISSLRNLSLSEENDDDETSFYRATFLPLWVKRFNEIIETEINKLLSTEESLSAIHTKILDNSITRGNTLSTTDYIFSPEFLSDSTSAKGADYANILIDALSDFASGSIGDIKDISHEYKMWLNSISSIQAHIEEIGKMKGHLSIRYDNSSSLKEIDVALDDDEDDEESAEFWRRTEKKVISTNYAFFKEHASKSLTNVHKEMLKRVQKLSEVNGKNTRGLVLLLRAVLLLESHFQSLAPVEKESSHRFVMNAYSILADCVVETILKPLDVELYRTDAKERQLWINGVCPSGPSLYILDYLSKFIRNLMGEVGHDELLWCNEDGLQVLRQKVGLELLSKLNETASAITELSKLEAKDEVKPEPTDATPTDPQPNENAAEPKLNDDGVAKTDSDESTPDEVEPKTETETIDSEPNATDSETAPDVSDEPPEEVKDEATPKSGNDLATILLQIDMDSRFICQLIGIPLPKDQKYQVQLADDVLQTMERTTQEVARRMHILYIPLAL